MNGVVAWFADPAHWQGPDGLPTRLAEHLQLTGLTMLAALVVSMPVALVLGHVGRGGALATNVSYIGRAAPTFAVLVIFAVAPAPFGLNTLSTVTALTLFAIPPLLTNTYVGIRQVPQDAVDAARGMGMSGWQVLTRVELPLAAPTIVGGLRLATTQVVATVTIAALVAGGGLGRVITRGFSNQDIAQLLAGSLVVAALALVFEGAFALAQRSLRAVPAG